MLELGFHEPDEPSTLSLPIREFFRDTLCVFCFHCEIFSLLIKGNDLVMCLCMYLTVQHCPVLGRKTSYLHCQPAEIQVRWVLHCDQLVLCYL